MVRERARRVIPADGTERRETPIEIPLTPHAAFRCTEEALKHADGRKRHLKQKKKGTTKQKHKSSESCSKTGDWEQNPC